MKVVVPTEVTPAKLISSNVAEPETGWPNWVSGTSYAVGAQVTYNHRLWVSAKAANTDTPGAAIDPAPWTDQGASNRWKMFDEKVGSQTLNPGSISVQIQPGQVVNSVGVFNMHGSTLHIVMTDPIEGIVYDETFSLVDAGVTNWYEYFFSPIGSISDYVVTTLPAYGSATITVTLDAGAEVAAIGMLTVGAVQELGCTQWGVSGGITDFSRKVRDDFGVFTIVERSFAKERTFNVNVASNQMAMLENTLAGLRAKPVVWIGDDRYEFTLVVGFFREINFVLEFKDISRLTIDVEGVI